MERTANAAPSVSNASHRIAISRFRRGVRRYRKLENIGYRTDLSTILRARPPSVSGAGVRPSPMITLTAWMKRLAPLGVLVRARKSRNFVCIHGGGKSGCRSRAIPRPRESLRPPLNDSPRNLFGQLKCKAVVHAENETSVSF